MRWAAPPALALLAACAGDPSERPARWAYIATAIIEPNCATSGCHSRLTRTAGLELEQRHGAYVLLVGGDFVVPYAPDASKLLYLLRGDNVARMPPDQPLPDPDIALIERWILDGAQED